jgi:hypothetical protein
VSDPFAHLKENRWREVAEIDHRFERGEIDDEAWHRAMAQLVVPAYLAADTPWEQSGKSGSRDDWVSARSLVGDAIERDGSFLDVGCASGYLMECLPRWTSFRVEPYGLEIAQELAVLARRRLPEWADRIWVGNALTWKPPRTFTYIRTGLEYVPSSRRRDLVEHLLAFCERLIVGVFNEHESEDTTAELLRSYGFAPTGRARRSHPRKHGMEYRIVWLDA